MKRFLKIAALLLVISLVLLAVLIAGLTPVTESQRQAAIAGLEALAVEHGLAPMATSSAADAPPAPVTASDEERYAAYAEIVEEGERRFDEDQWRDFSVVSHLRSLGLSFSTEAQRLRWPFTGTG